MSGKVGHIGHHGHGTSAGGGMSNREQLAGCLIHVIVGLLLAGFMGLGLYMEGARQGWW